MEKEASHTVRGSFEATGSVRSIVKSLDSIIRHIRFEAKKKEGKGTLE